MILAPANFMLALARLRGAVEFQPGPSRGSLTYTQRVAEESAGRDAGFTEPRWPAVVAFAAIALLSLVHPPAVTPGPRWLVTGLTGLLIIPALIAHRTNQGGIAHALLICANAVVTLTLIASVFLLIVALPPKTIEATVLLRSAAALWVTNILIFALWYWRLDAGGPYVRERRDNHGEGAFLFPQMAMRDEDPEWRPGFVDYLFLAFNTSTALSPADTQVLSRWAKLLMMGQASLSLTIIVILAARAINIL
ncbi:MAG: hypothetical protein NVSMB68_09750 [Thermoanaerobaculia bacterium]